MSTLTRDVLIRTIVANEMKEHDGSNYTQQLKNIYHKWEHQSSDVLCQKFNQIEKLNVTVDILKP
jgi:hypothetical protein